MTDPMTTTAAAWRHVGDTHYAGSSHCPCRTPTPDPSSPCGFEGCWLRWLACHCDDPSEGCPYDHPINADGGHPFVPTSCACGHSLEAVR